jgi:hypothetical protein
MGLEFEDDDDEPTALATPDTVLATITPAVFNSPPYPPAPKPFLLGPKDLASPKTPPSCLIFPLPLRETALPRHRTAAAAQVSATPRSTSSSDIVTEFLIGHREIASIYLSPDPFYKSFEEEVDLRRFDLTKHRMAGLCLAHYDGRLYLGGIAKSTPCAKIPRWQTRIKGAWLIKVGPHTVSTIQEAQDAFTALSLAGTATVTLLFSHPIVRQDISHDGLPIVSSAPFTQDIHDQLNNRWDFTSVADHLRDSHPFEHVLDGDVINCVMKAMKLTRGKLLQQSDWQDWQESEYLQLNQYNSQGMFGSPIATKDGDAIFHLVWTDGRKLGVFVRAPPAPVRSLFSLKHMRTAWNKLVLDCSMQLQRRRTSSCLVRTSPTHLQRHPHLSNRSLSGPTAPFMNGGSNTSNKRLYLKDT